VRFVVGLSLIIRAFEDPYGNLEGNRLGALARLFAQNVRIYAYPMTAADLRESLITTSASGWEWSEKSGWVSAAQLRRAGPLGHLFAYLLASNFICPYPSASGPESRRLIATSHCVYDSLSQAFALTMMLPTGALLASNAVRSLHCSRWFDSAARQERARTG
jgi:hypothetical protein